MKINSLQTKSKKFRYAFYVFSVFILLAVSCSSKNRKEQQNQIESQLSSIIDSVYRIATSKYEISNKLDTLDHFFQTTLFYQTNIKDGEYQLIELRRHDISDIYLQDSTYYLMIWDNSYSNISVEISFDSKDLQKLLNRELHAFLVVNIDRVKKIHFKMDGEVSDSDSSSDYYEIDLNLANTRKALLKGSVKDIFFIENKTKVK